MSWTIKSTSTDVKDLLLEESLFFNGNGYIGVRGNLEEGLGENTSTIHGSYLNAFHDHVDIDYGEKLYAFPDTQQRLLNVIDTQGVQIWVGEGEAAEQFSLFSGTVIACDRILHLDKGQTERRVHWKSSAGDEVIIRFERLVSFTTRELFGQYITITPVSGSVPIRIVTLLNGDVENFSDPSDPRVASGDTKRLHVRHAELIDHASYVEVETYESGLSAGALSTVAVSAGDTVFEHTVSDKAVETVVSFILTKETTFEKRTFFADTVRYHDLQKTLIEIKNSVKQIPFSEIKKAQKHYLTGFWSHTDITIKGKADLQEGIRFNLFHLLQSAGQDGVSNISAKGLSGEGYEGHYFWDTEIYLLPMFTLTNPELAKKLLLYRYSILDSARERAKEMGHKQGALFPWRTISGGECSSFFPAGTAQYHISADIAHSYIQYYLATHDREFLHEAGVEVLIETARLWIDAGHFYNDEFRIDAVTGPDEYTCVVNNNYYTNAMAKQNLQWASKFALILKEEDPAAWDALKSTLSVKDEELEEFVCAGEKMYLPVDEALNINPQDDTFLRKDRWDFENTPEDKYPLLLHYHPLTLYRYQVCKQADTVLAHFLLEDEQSEAVMKNSYDYYEDVTTHDSSLSSCVFSMMAARVGDLDKAYDYFIETARLDLDNTHGNTKDGLHMANMGGTWLAIVAGFAGLRVKESGIYFRPQVPKAWEGYTFRLQYQGRLMLLTLDRAELNVTLLSGEPLLIHIWDQAYTVSEDLAVHVNK